MSAAIPGLLEKLRAAANTALLASLALGMGAAHAQVFPLKGRPKAFTGETRHTAPVSPDTYRIADPADWYYEWPTPPPVFSYTAHKNQKKVGKNQEPGYYACRPSTRLPQGCGRPHRGVDIYARYGTPIVAPEDGMIVSYQGVDVYAPAGTESKNGGYGRAFRLRGNSGHEYRFAHTMGFSEAVAAGAGVAKDFGETAETKVYVPVKAGETIGYVGRSGGVVNPHLHLQVTRAGRDVDPAQILRPSEEPAFEARK